MLGSLGSRWENEIQSPIHFQEEYLTWGTEDWGSDGRGEEGIGTFFLFYRREKTKG